jgi:putative peptidoglycan lipid II flippase
VRKSAGDTRTPLFTNSGQLIARILLISILLPSMDVVAIPAAFAISSTLETLTLAGILFLKLRAKSQEQQAATNLAMER